MLGANISKGLKTHPKLPQSNNKNVDLSNHKVVVYILEVCREGMAWEKGGSCAFPGQLIQSNCTLHPCSQVTSHIQSPLPLSEISNHELAMLQRQRQGSDCLHSRLSCASEKREKKCRTVGGRGLQHNPTQFETACTAKQFHKPQTSRRGRFPIWASCES